MDKKLTAMGTSMLILKLLEAEDMYGYQMIKELGERSENVFSLKEGTLYPILHNLEKDGSIESYEKASETGRMRKYYRLTKEGGRALSEKQKEWNAFQGAVEKVMKRPAYESVFCLFKRKGGLTYEF